MNALLLLGLITTNLVAAPSASSQSDEIISEADGYLIQVADQKFKDGEWESLLPILRFRVELYPADYDAVTDLGFILENGRKADDALAVYAKYRAAAPTDVDRFLPEATLYFGKKNWAKVVETLAPIAETKCHPNNLRMLARSYEKLGNLEKAESTYAEIFKRNPKDGAARVNVDRIKKLRAAQEK